MIPMKAMWHSSTATIEGIDNTPPKNLMDNIVATCVRVNIIQMHAASLGGNIVVTSGYRCKELNGKVGGSKKSYHLTGQAVDFKVIGIKDEEIIDYLFKPKINMWLGVREILRGHNYIHVSFVV